MLFFGLAKSSGYLKTFRLSRYWRCLFSGSLKPLFSLLQNINTAMPA
ncbi:hypothetical protein HMPREF9371_2395 [Neisseria shayeganii 871]|uniref:Uncharacterized protein n=1 Tax=Neisseria shayeganii 871 TaxID=1032488 RepID=G4CLA4_9NEIS|nr:hypothetical protein HMPREF9371_2395 [Neisseria shayeganii 871]